MTTNDIDDQGPTRRQALQRTGLVVGGAAAVWAAPSVTTLGRALAAGSPPPTTGGSGAGPFNLFTVANSYNAGQVQTGPFFFFQSATANVYTPSTDYFSHTVGGTASGFHGTDGTFPYFYTVTGGTYTDSTLSVPPNTFVVHPGPNTAAVVGFTNTSGQAHTVTLTGAVARKDAASGRGNGTVLSIVDAAGTPAQGASTAATGSNYNDGGSFNASFAAVANGSTVYVIVGNNGDYGYDTTELDLTVTLS